jgi:hypothetical protein
MTRQRRFEALYSAQRAAEVNRQLKEYIRERERTNTEAGTGAREEQERARGTKARPSMSR